jgi:endonuclease-3
MGGRIGGRVPVAQIIAMLDRAHPDARLALDFDSPFQLLVALILAAQSTDAKTNEITATLFAQFPDAAAFAAADSSVLEAAIHSSGFFRQKARALQKCCRALLDHHGGEVPRDHAALLALPGVGRKTANVLRGNAWGIPGIGVDTHVGRLSQRLGMTTQSDPDKIEADLVRQVPEVWQIRFCHLLQYHGRRVCHARKPACPDCVVAALCPYPAKTAAAPHPTPKRSAWGVGRPPGVGSGS